MFTQEFEKTSGRLGSTLVGGTLGPMFAWIPAEEEKGLRTAGGSLAGAILGAMGGLHLGNSKGPTKAMAIGRLLGHLGGAGGAYLAHGPDRKDGGEY